MKTTFQELLNLAHNDPVKLGQLLKAHPDLREVRGLHEETLLHFCVVEGMMEAVKTLLPFGDVNCRNRFGGTPLMDAAMLGNDAMVELLLVAGSDPNVKDANGDTIRENLSLLGRTNSTIFRRLK